MSLQKPFAKLPLLLALSLSVSTVATGYASAQDQGPPPGYQGQSQGYDQGPPPGYQGQQGYNQGPPPGYQGQQGYDQGPPPGYDPNNPNNPPPPPPGYNGAPPSAQEQQQDMAYQANAERWMANNCIQKHNDAVAGSVIGGVVGAVLGSAIGGRGNHFAGAVVGGTVGSVAGGAIGASAASGPGCPPGYVLREGAVAFDGPPGYLYAAPGWYQPWVWYGGRWAYRPYPYHRYYYGHYYRGGRGYEHRGDHGRW